MTASLSGNVATTAKLAIPAWGRAWADVELTEPVVLTGLQTLQLAEVTYAMTVASGGVTEAGRARYRLVAGHGGWGKIIKKQGFQNDAGVTAAVLLRDAANACGEQLGALPSDRVGAHFARQGNRPASAVLNLVAPRGWYVDSAGITQFGQRAEEAYEGSGTVVRLDKAIGVVELAVDEIANLAPGVIVAGNPAAKDIEIEVTPKRITVRAYWSPKANRRATAIGQIVEGLFPNMAYRGMWNYRVVSQSGNRLNLQPVRVATGMPDLEFVPDRCVAGVRVTHTLGSHVVVGFLDADPSRPAVIGHDEPDSPSWSPEALIIEATDITANEVAIDEQGNLTTPTGAEVAAQGGLVKLSTHLHPTAMGPSGPPTPGT